MITYIPRNFAAVFLVQNLMHRCDKCSDDSARWGEMKPDVWKKLCSHYQRSVLFITHDIEKDLLLADRIDLFSARPARIRLDIDLSNAGDLLSLKEQILAILAEKAGDI